MSHHRMDLYPIAERVYLRMQAQDLLRRSLKELSMEPLRHMLDQQLAVEQPDIDLLGEMLMDINSQYVTLRERRFESRERVVATFREGYELEIAGYVPPAHQTSREHLSAEGLFEYLAGQLDDLDEDEVFMLGEMFTEATELVAVLTRQIEVVESLMGYLRDWLMALTVEVARENPPATQQSPQTWIQ